MMMMMVGVIVLRLLLLWFELMGNGHCVVGGGVFLVCCVGFF